MKKLFGYIEVDFLEKKNEESVTKHELGSSTILTNL
jgi:hypothetical protein